MKDKRKIKSKWTVQGWLNGDDHDAGKPPSATITVTALDESEADTKGDKKLKSFIGECDVVVSTQDNHK
jgi:hypothetical protein